MQKRKNWVPHRGGCTPGMPPLDPPMQWTIAGARVPFLPPLKLVKKKKMAAPPCSKFRESSGPSEKSLDPLLGHICTDFQEIFQTKLFKFNIDMQLLIPHPKHLLFEINDIKLQLQVLHNASVHYTWKYMYT